MGKTQTTFTGACGEFYAAAYLSRHDLMVALPRAGVQGIDLFVVGTGSDRHLSVQVKSSANAYGKEKGEEYFSWVQRYPPAEDAGSDALWYAYVNLNDWRTTVLNQPDIYFIPSVHVMKRMHQLRSEAAGKAEWRTHFWMPIGEFEKYKNKTGLALLKSAMKTSQALPPDPLQIVNSN